LLCEAQLSLTEQAVAATSKVVLCLRPSLHFSIRYKDELDCRYLNTIDLETHKADSEHSYRQYFVVLQQKIIQYNIEPHNCYNMDEKGFLIGHLQKGKRISPKALMKAQKLICTGKDGARRWILLIATICADGSSLPPALIYKATSGNLQDTWLQDYKPEEHPCWFASSPNGWTSDELGLSWLQSLFDPQTSEKAKRDWRLLMLDGHGSHCTLDFLEWCHKRRILVAIYPPHSTHRLQPLDVSLFRPLATYYSQALDAHTRQSLDLSSVSKRDLAFDKASSEENIWSGWRKTGIEPWDPAQMLDILDKEEGEVLYGSPASAASESLGSSCFDSPGATRKMRRIVSRSVTADGARKDRTIRLLGDAYLGASARAKLAEEREKGLLQSIDSEKKKLQDPNLVSSCPDGSPAHPHLIVQRGVTCLQCRYRTASTNLLQRHMTKEHGQRRCRDESDKDTLWVETDLQSWSQNGKREFWIVRTGQEDVPSPVEQSPRRKRRLSQIHKAEVERAARRQRLMETDSGEDALLSSNWIRRTGWTEMFLGANRSFLVMM
jgi:hypothetical protein